MLFSFSVVLKVFILVCLIKYLEKYENVFKTAIFYAGVFFLLALIFNISSISVDFILTLLVWVIVDFVSGYAFFWLLVRFL